MADAALTNAEARLENIEAELAAMRLDVQAIQARMGLAEAERERVRSFIATWHEMAGKPVPEHLESNATVPDTTQRRIRPKNPDREFVVGKSLEIIRAHGRPMPRKELFDALAESGIVIQGKDPEMVLSTMLWRTQDRIVRLPPHGYWPKDEVYGPAFYDPQIDSIIGAAAAEPEGGIEADDADEDPSDELPLA